MCHSGLVHVRAEADGQMPIGAACLINGEDQRLGRKSSLIRGSTLRRRGGEIHIRRGLREREIRKREGVPQLLLQHGLALRKRAVGLTYASWLTSVEHSPL